MSEGEWGESLTDRLVQHLQSLGLIRSGEESFDLRVDPCSYPHLQAVFQRKNKKLSYSREAWSRVECLLDTSKAPGHAEELPSLVWLVCLFQLFYLLVKMTLNDHTYVHNCIFTKNNSSCQSFFLSITFKTANNVWDQIVYNIIILLLWLLLTVNSFWSPQGPHLVIHVCSICL